MPGCSAIRYKTLDDVNATELGFQRLEFTPIVVSKMRYLLRSTILSLKNIFEINFTIYIFRNENTAGP